MYYYCKLIALVWFWKWDRSRTIICTVKLKNTTYVVCIHLYGVFSTYANPLRTPVRMLYHSVFDFTWNNSTHRMLVKYDSFDIYVQRMKEQFVTLNLMISPNILQPSPYKVSKNDNKQNWIFQQQWGKILGGGQVLTPNFSAR